MHQSDLQGVTQHRCRFSSMHINARHLVPSDYQ
uniref:Uncharacterized protein n=1 Tax=Siphoviridae sp. ctt0c4 TaxID=2825702 RepID=A0A8S5V3A7_9CAUD|nr:MAG TPA: hypothetical protein [Siphoviridae sp. ctt0c4]